MAKPKIETFKVSRYGGITENWYLLNLFKHHRDNLNEIGSTGKIHGDRISVSEYLNIHVAGPKEVYGVETIVSTDYRDSLLVIKVTI